jgi:hypothetical protein
MALQLGATRDAFLAAGDKGELVSTKQQKQQMVAEVRRIVAQTASDFHERGHTRRIAIEMAAKVLGIAATRTNNLIYGKIFRTTKDELLAVREAFILHTEAEADDLQRRADVLRARRRELEMERETIEQ